MKSKITSLAFCFVLLSTGFSSCAYVQSTARQTAYNFSDDFRRDGRPDNRVIKVDTYLIFGKIDADLHDLADSLTVVALGLVKNNWIVVDRKNLFSESKTFVLNLPRGEYRIVVLDDGGRGGTYLFNDIKGMATLSLPRDALGRRIVTEFELDTSSNILFEKFDRLRIAVTTISERRSNPVLIPQKVAGLDAAAFSESMSKVGLYNPPQFLQLAPSLLYCLGDDDSTKTPVIFVHGISGSAREFSELSKSFDTSRYSLWFFHYPSGYDLNLLSDAFYELALSGHYIASEGRFFIIIAHSMGGLVVREALNQLNGTLGEARVSDFVTIASPLGGMAFARSATSAPLVLPVWRDLPPESHFIARLYRRALPDEMTYHLFYTSGKLKEYATSEPGDGVVPLSSQLCANARAEANFVEGVDESHAEVLKSRLAIELIKNAVKGSPRGRTIASLTLP